MQQGICKLCLRERQLQASHLIPRALYKKARGTGKTGNQDPTVVTLDRRWQSSFQPKDYVLCRQCEARFSEHGEHYTMGLVSQQDGTFPLLDMLSNAPRRLPGPARTIYTIKDTPNIDRERLAYFAMSVFWRASVHTWSTDKASQRSFFAPSENGKTKDRTVGFGARGIMFFLRTTNTPLPFQRRLSMVNNLDSIITTCDCRQHSMWWVG